MKFVDYLVLVLIILLLFALSSCTKDVEDVNACLLGDCDFTMQIDKSSQPDSYVDESGYHHIKFFGPKYFSVKTTYSQLKSNYVIGNIPLIESQWDTNMWYTLVDGIVMWTSRYSPFGEFTANFSFSIPTSTNPIVIPSVSDLNELQNASGQYMRNGVKGPVISTSPNVDFVGKHNFFFLPEMIGDTLVIENRTEFAYGSEVSETVKKTIKVILE
jgi:hypothetical protein